MGLRRSLVLVAMLAFAVPARAQLIVFVSSKAAPVTATWRAEQLPFVEQLAKRQDVELRIIDVATEGAPLEIGITPLVVFQNHRGRSTYQGRSSNQTRLENFVRTSKVIAQSTELWVREAVPVWQCERAKILAPIKLTALAGATPDQHDPATFEAECNRAIHAGFRQLSLESKLLVERSDRTFYFDFYPYRDESGRFFVSTALFSQFHCKEAIFRSAESFSGAWEQRAEVLGRAAAALETETLRLMRESKLGDAFDCIPRATTVKTWEELGLELPAPPAAGTQSADLPQLGTKWRVAELGKDAPPRVLFHFPAPLDGTAGEVGAVSGELTLEESTSLANAKGQVIVQVDSITLGVLDLDQVVKSAAMLDAKRHPQASFTLSRMLEQEGALEFGRQTRALLQGTFEMKGQSVPIDVTALWEPIVNERGEPRLLVDGAFSIRLLEPFGIKGPDGPSPQKDTLLFHFALELRPH